MPSENKTPNVGLNQWQGNEYPKRQDFVEDNLIIDNRIKELQESVGDITPEEIGAETPSGAQAKANIAAGSALAAANSYTDQEVGNVDTKVGPLANLTSLIKTSIVNAINSLKGEVDEHKDNKAAHDNVIARTENNEYNIYQLMLQDYYNGKQPYKKGLFFDGFINDDVIDNDNSTINLDTINRCIKSKITTRIEQLDREYEGTFGNASTTNALGQTFKMPADVEPITNCIISVNLYTQREPTDGVLCKIYNYSGSAIGSLIGTSAIHDSTEIAGVNTNIEDFIFNDVVLLPGNQYAFTLERTGNTSSVHYYRVRYAYPSNYSGGTEITRNGSTWSTNPSYDLYFEITSTIPNMLYVSKEQIFSQDISNGILYVKSKNVHGCSITADISIHTDLEDFQPMLLKSSQELDGGYREDKFISSNYVGNKVKIRLKLNRPNTEIEYEVYEYGCILGVS